MNVYLLKQEFLDIAEVLEENGGELTPEIHEALKINREAVNYKVKSYTDVIKSLEEDISAIDAETKRLKLLKERKAKAIETIKSIIIDAINFFGETKKSGVKYIDYGTGVVSIRKSNAVEVNDILLDDVCHTIRQTLEFLRDIKQLDVDTMTSKDIIDILASDTDTLGKPKLPVHINSDELNSIKLKIDVNIPVKDILLNAEKYDILKGIVKYYYDFKMDAVINKTEMKELLKDDSVDYGNIARLKTNENIQIK